MFRIPGRLALPVLLASALAVLAAPPPASAGPIVGTAPDCAAQSLARTFLPWADPADYTPLPAGDLERGAPGWTFEDGARTAEGNEPFDEVGAPGDHRLLVLPQGGVATSPSICVGLGHPTMRFFLKRTAGVVATVAVEVLVEDALGGIEALPVGLVPAAPEWAPGLPVLVVANLLPLLPGEHTAVAFRLRAVTGAAVVDEVHVDPWRMR
jgi:hypothetical protein